MEQWTEQTSLRLLELIASIAISPDAESHMASNWPGLQPAGSSCPAVVDVLGSLADSDLHFREWLQSEQQHFSRSSAAEIAPEVVPTQPSDQAVSERRADSAVPTEQSFTSRFDWQVVAEQWLQWLAAEPIDVVARANSPYRRLLVANARAALRLRGLIEEREKSRHEIACELAYDMAYGLSHELNNPLANIATRARLLAEEEASERKRQLLAAIVDQAMRGCEMIADLMLIARPPAFTFEPVELGSVVRAIFARARPWAESRGVSLQIHLPEQAVIVRTDRSAIDEALWALLRNAMEVAHQQIILTLLVPPSGDQADSTGPATLSVQDDGPGISSHALAHAFNPYFSGREAGRGLGTGLAKAERIARLSGGRVSIANAAAGGCIAQIFLPVCSQ